VANSSGNGGASLLRSAIPPRQSTTPHCPTSGSSSWRLWPLTTGSSRSGQRIARRISKKPGCACRRGRSHVSRGRILDAEHLYEQGHPLVTSKRLCPQRGGCQRKWPGASTGRAVSNRSHSFTCETARQCYLSWGADGKVRQTRPTLSAPPQGRAGARRAPHNRHADRTPGARNGPQDLAGGVRRKSCWKTLLTRCSAPPSSTAGAETWAAHFCREVQSCGSKRKLLPRGNSFTIELRDTPVSSAELPAPVIQYAARTQESVILDDAWIRGSFSDDEYIRRVCARSILCLPARETRPA